MFDSQLFVTKMIQALFISASFMFLSTSVYAGETAVGVDKELEIFVTSAPDVVVETLSMLLPATTKKAMEYNPARIIKLNDLTKQFGYGVIPEDPYAPYYTKDHPAYKQTVLYKMYHPTDKKSILPMIKKFGFETVLFAANKLFWYAGLFFVFMAVGRISWVAMTVADDNKAVQKLIAISPAITLSLLLIKPFGDGYNYAQLILVGSFLLSNYLASVISLFGSMELYKHVFNSFQKESLMEGIQGITKVETARLYDELSEQAYKKVLAEKIVSGTLSSIMNNEPLTSESITTALNRYNDKKGLKGAERVSGACFGLNWSYELAYNDSCKALANDPSYKIRNFDFPTEKIGELDKFSQEIAVVLDMLYMHEKKYACNVIGTSMPRADRANRLDTMMLCKYRDGNGGFDTKEKFHGFKKIGSDYRPLWPVLDKQLIASELYNVYVKMVSEEVEKIPYNEGDQGVKNRGFFITPIDAVNAAVNRFYNDSKRYGLKGTLNIATSTVISRNEAAGLELIPTSVSELMVNKTRVDEPILKNDSKGILDDFNFATVGAGEEFNIDVFGLLSSVTDSFWNNSYNDLSPKEKQDKIVVGLYKEHRVTPIEPYTALNTLYQTLMPAAIASLMFSNVFKPPKVPSKDKQGSNMRRIHSILRVFGGICFMAALLCKVIGSLLFMSLTIGILIKSFKRLIIFVITAPIITVNFVKDGFSETRDDDDNLVVSKYLLNAVVRVFVDLPMMFIAILCAYILGTFSANLMGYLFLTFIATSIDFTTLSVASMLTGMLSAIALWLVVLWGLYKGVNLMEYIHKKGTDFVDDATGVDGDTAGDELLGMVKSTFMPTRYL